MDMRIKASPITSCKECGCTNLTWQPSNTNHTGIQQGRLTTSDVECVFVLGCDHCSETLQMISADRVAVMMSPHVEDDQAYYRLNEHNNETEHYLDEAAELLGNIVRSGQAYRECTDKSSATGLRVAAVIGYASQFKAKTNSVAEEEVAGDENWRMNPCKLGHRDVGASGCVASCNQCDESITAATTQEAFEQWNASHPALPV